MLENNTARDRSHPVEVHLGRVDDQCSSLILSLSNISSQLPKHQSKSLIICLDNSGSMAGSGISQAKQAIQTLLEQVHGYNEQVILITFNSTATVLDLSGKSLIQQVECVQKIEATGGTSFSSAFQAMTQLHTLGQEVAIVFFTDGQDCESVEKREQDVKNLTCRLRTETNAFEFHTIGFTREHDVQLLTNITQLGSSQGSFQYAESSSIIASCVENLIGLVRSRSLSGVLKVVHSEEHEKIILSEKVSLEETENDGIKITCFLKNDLVFHEPSLKFFLEISGLEERIEIQIPSTHSVLSQSELISLQIKYIEKKLLDYAVEISSKTFDKSQLSVIHQEGQQLEERLLEITQEIQRIKDRILRKSLFTLRESIHNSLTNFNQVLADAMVGHLSNDKIATLNSLAYRSITKRSLQKKLDQRAQANVALFEKSEQFVKEYVNSLNFTQLRQEFESEADQLGSCFITCSNWIDLLEQQDCLCLTLNVARTQACVMDPSRVQILSIGTSLMSAEAFLDSVLFSLGNTENHAQVHGGFKDVELKKQNQEGQMTASIVTGTAREAITGVLPLYINETHWKVAKEKMKSIMGFVATLDVMGYSFQQIKTIPFLVLSKLLAAPEEERQSEFYKFQFKLVLDTCLKIYDECSENSNEEGIKMNDEVVSLVKNYNSNPLTRTVDVIPSNVVLLSQLYCAIKKGHFDMNSIDHDLFFKNVAEETLRRSGIPNIDSISESQLLQLLNVNIDTVVHNYIHTYKKEHAPKKDNRVMPFPY
ncbi:hypothetical protein C9374_005625 [Naegleria lovaniensis]|uniref:VWFA domain-containing protein n=1 Tax=Naegleria lovaniensis TaxID=51637 RepID=A0AA88GQQ4_NAELO|nr:uncharacterized protein C9374_005625 [Naegleria lovaniensis]KAG2382423.1 hypothetical protein C9374_005625 [Naegleria lovaniensis]